MSNKEDLFEWTNQDTLSPSTNIPSKTLVMVETAFMSSTCALLWLIDYYFPLGPFLRVLFPLPIALLYLRCGARAAWMSVLVSGLLLSILMGPPRSIIFTIPFALIGVQLGICWRRGTDWIVSIFLGTIVYLLGFFFRFWLFSIIIGEDLWRYVINQVTDFLKWAFLNLDILAQPNVLMVQIGTILLISVSGFLYLTTVHVAAYLILERMKQPIPQPPAWLENLF